MFLYFSKCFCYEIHLYFQEFLIHRKSGTGILGRVTDSLQNLTTTYLVRQQSPEFDAVKEYVNTFGEKLGQLEKVGRRLYKERSGNRISFSHSLILLWWITIPSFFILHFAFCFTAYQSELAQFQQTFSLWATSEPELSPLLKALATAIEKNSEAQQRNLLDTFSPSFEQVSRCQ